MGKRRKQVTSSEDSSDEEIARLAKKLQKLKRRRKYRRESSSASSVESSDKENGGRSGKVSRARYSRSPSPALSIPEIIIDPVDMEQEGVAGNSQSGEGDPLAEDVPTLSAEVLRILGDDIAQNARPGDVVHKDIATRWQQILSAGISEETRRSLTSKYPPHINCPLLGAPKLNPEARAAANNMAIKRDERLQAVQSQIGASLAALGKVLTMLLGSKENEGGEDNKEVIERISDASRLLADVHWQQSEVRRNLVALEFNADLRIVATEEKPNEWLFGENLGERIKTAKALKRSGLELKIKKGSYGSFHPQRLDLNSKSPPKRQASHRVGGQKLALRRTTPAHQRTSSTRRYTNANERRGNHSIKQRKTYK